MNRTLPLLLSLLLLVPTVASVPGLPASGGLVNACGTSTNDNPCRFARIIYDTNVSNGTTRTYRGDYLAVGTIVVEPGGTVVFEDARVTFNATSGGVSVQPGGTLRVLDSVFEEEIAGSTYAVDALAGSSLTFTDSTLHGGDGMRIATEDALLTRSLLTQIPLALRLQDVSITVEQNRFVDNTVAVNQTGGYPVLQHNTFEGGEYCVRDWLSDPTIVWNVFRGCHVGIWHERSESIISNNDMSDSAAPPGGGIFIVHTMSPVVENNTISRFGSGIVIVDARGYLRNNTVFDNVGDGIRVERNSAPMDIQGNLVQDNGGAGIRLVDARAVPVHRNTVTGNDGDGIVVSGNSVDVTLVDNVVRDSGASGIVVTSAGVELENTSVTTSATDGIVVAASGVRITGGASTANGRDGLRVDSALDVTIDGLDSSGNTRDGVRIERSAASIARVNASHNGGSGFRYDPKGPWQPLGQTDLVSVRAFGNAVAGLHNVAGNATFSRNAWWQDNVQAGVRNDDLASVVDVRESYWGSPSGPTHVTNPSGRGDHIVGAALYLPYLTAPPA